LKRRTRLAPKRATPRRSSRTKDRGYMAAVHGLPCCAEDLSPCFGRIEAAHVRIGTDGGMGVKPSDIYTIPLCTGAHAEQHAIGEPAFARKYGIDMRRIADELARVSPHRKKWIEP
jgi:hypothetical protein